LHLEVLETRNLLSAAITGILPPTETINLARDLVGTQEAVGNLGNGPAGAADVDWYYFHLDTASAVILATNNQAEGRSLVPVLSLYNTDDPFKGDPASSDYYERLGHRLLAQASGTAQAPDVTIERYLGPGDYYVAVSGAGNLFFNPFVAGSGYDGSTGDFALTLTTTDLGLGLTNPVVVAMDPGPSGPNDPLPYHPVATAPFTIRVDLSSDIDPSSFDFTQVQLLYNSSAPSFDAASSIPVNVTYSVAAHEIQLNPMATLTPGYYEVVPGVDNPLGLSLIFQVTGVGGNPPADGIHTQIASHDLGEAPVGQLVQVPGAIGDDYIDGVTPFDTNEMQMYHFQVSSSGQYQITAEVFANRIGSPLNAALSLYRLDSGNQFTLVAANADTTNQTQGADGSQPLYLDPALDAGLTAGDYYLAVSSGLNVPDAAQGLHLGDPGVFDPNQPSQPGWGDGSTGTYVLNFLIQPHQGAPHVISVTRDDGNQPGASPARFTVQFDEPVNMQQLAYDAYQAYTRGGPNQMPAIFIDGSGGPYFPRLESYDDATNTATFVMLNGLPSGSYELHLSGANGLEDLAGNLLVGNDAASGDYVYSFTVNDPVRSGVNDPQHRYNRDPNTDPQNLGVLFPQELVAPLTINGDSSFFGVDITRDPSLYPPGTSTADTQDVYEFQVLQSQTYVVNLLDHSPSPLGGTFSLFLSTDAAGKNALAMAREYQLDPGVYYIHVGGWNPADAANIKYDLNIAMLGNPERPTALTIGAAPAARLRVVSTLLPPPPSTTSSSIDQGNHGPGNIPSNILVDLGAGSLGGSGTVGNLRAVVAGLDVLDRVVAQAPRFLGTEEFVQLVALFQTLDHTGDEMSEAVTEKIRVDHSGASFSLPAFPWNEVVEFLFRFWLGDTLVDHPRTDVSDAATLQESQTEDLDEQALDTAAPAGDSTLAGLAVGGMFLMSIPELRRGQGSGVRGRKARRSLSDLWSETSDF
jgi:hypothetical protein